MRIGKRIKSYLSNDDGNVGMMLAIAIVPLILGVGAALDYSKLTSDVNRAQAAADAAVLAASKQYYESFAQDEAQASGQDFADLNLDTHFGIGENQIETKLMPLDDGSFEVQTTITGQTDNSFMGLVGKPISNWKVVARSEISSPPKIEVMLVLDVSASMHGSKIARLKTAVSEFINATPPFERGDNHLTISIIPYGGSVSFGSNAATWLDPVRGFRSTDQFHGCFRNRSINAQTPGTLEAYRQGYAGSRNEPFCPPESSKAFLFSRNASQLQAHVRGLELSWGTDSPYALVWATRFLDPEWRKAARHFDQDGPKPIDDNTHKIVVLLTDGAVAIVDNNQDGIRDKKAQKIPQEQSVAVFDKRCETLKQTPNLDLYAIGFDVPEGIFDRSLENCTAGNGRYFDADLKELVGVFQDISNDLKAIRITH